MENNERLYYDDALCHLMDVADGDKPVMCVSAGKSTLAYEMVAMLAKRANLALELVTLTCEDGKLHEHAFVSAHGKVHNASPAKAMVRLIEDYRDEDPRLRMERHQFQYRMGAMFGYPPSEIVDFVVSDVAKTCVCDCCGGKPE
jgi:hypothetical protein